MNQLAGQSARALAPRVNGAAALAAVAKAAADVAAVIAAAADVAWMTARARRAAASPLPPAVRGHKQPGRNPLKPRSRRHQPVLHPRARAVARTKKRRTSRNGGQGADGGVADAAHPGKIANRAAGSPLRPAVRQTVKNRRSRNRAIRRRLPPRPGTKPLPRTRRHPPNGRHRHKGLSTAPSKPVPQQAAAERPTGTDGHTQGSSGNTPPVTSDVKIPVKENVNAD